MHEKPLQIQAQWEDKVNSKFIFRVKDSTTKRLSKRLKETSNASVNKTLEENVKTNIAVDTKLNMNTASHSNYQESYDSLIETLNSLIEASNSATDQNEVENILAELVQQRFDIS